MASITELTCPLCSSAAHIKFDSREFCKHLRLFHVHQPGFKIPCRINGCQRSYTNLRSYQNHVSSVHNWTKDDKPMVVEEGCLPANDESYNPKLSDNDNSYDSDDDENHTGNHDHERSDITSEIPCYSQEMLQKSSAIFLLGLKEKYKLTQTAIQGIIEGFTDVTQQQISSLQSQVHCNIIIG